MIFAFTLNQNLQEQLNLLSDFNLIWYKLNNTIKISCFFNFAVANHQKKNIVINGQLSVLLF
jgi:hypothetical protein